MKLRPRHDWPEPPLEVLDQLAAFLADRAALWDALEAALGLRDRCADRDVRARFHIAAAEIAAELRGKKP